jgi:hypothetical protein
MDDALGLIGDHLDENFDGGLEASRTPEVALLAAFISNSSVTTPRPIEKKRVSRFHTPVDDRGLRVTGGVKVRQVVDDVFTRCRGVCFGTSAHGQVFTKNANKFAFSATTNPRNNASQWTSGYTSLTVANNPTVDAIFKNSPTKKQAGTTPPDAWIPRAGAGRTTNWEEHRLRLPTPPTTHRAPL